MPILGQAPNQLMYIRNMVDADVPAVQCIEQQTLSPWGLQAIRDELRQERGERFVAEVSRGECNTSEIVGWCASRLLLPEAELLEIAAHESWRRSGVAHALLKHLIHFLSQRSIQVLFLEVRSQNQSALNLYKKNGFLQIGVRPRYYSNPCDSALLYQKKVQ